MSQSKEAELITAVLMYAMRCLVEGDQSALRNMNFGPKEMEALQSMNLADLYRVDTLRAHCLEIQLNRHVFWPMVDHLREQRESEEIQQQLISVDAPLEMMSRLFGLGGREYTRWRRLLTLAPSVGRPAELDEHDNHTLWYAWQARVSETEEGESPILSGEDYLSLHQETGVAMRAIWSLTQRWTHYGNFESPSHAATAEPAYET